MFHFCAPRKRQKTYFSYVFKEYRNAIFGRNTLIWEFVHIYRLTDNVSIPWLVVKGLTKKTLEYNLWTLLLTSFGTFEHVSNLSLDAIQFLPIWQEHLGWWYFFGCKVDICKEFFFDVVVFYVCRVIERNQWPLS